MKKRRRRSNCSTLPAYGRICSSIGIGIGSGIRIGSGSGQRSVNNGASDNKSGRWQREKVKSLINPNTPKTFVSSINEWPASEPGIYFGSLANLRALVRSRDNSEVIAATSPRSVEHDTQMPLKSWQSQQ